MCSRGHCLGGGFEEMHGSDWPEKQTLRVDILPCRIDTNKRKTDLKSLGQALAIAHVQMRVLQL